MLRYCDWSIRTLIISLIFGIFLIGLLIYDTFFFMSNNPQFSRRIYANWLWLCCVILRITQDLKGTIMCTLDWLNWMWTGLDSHTVFCQLNLFSDVKWHIIRKLKWAKYNLIPSSLVLYCIVGCHFTITSFTFKHRHKHSFKFSRCLGLSARLVALLCPFSAAIIVSSQPSCPLTRTASHHRRGGGVSEVGNNRMTKREVFWGLHGWWLTAGQSCSDGNWCESVFLLTAQKA